MYEAFVSRLEQRAQARATPMEEVASPVADRPPGQEGQPHRDAEQGAKRARVHVSRPETG